MTVSSLDALAPYTALLDRGEHVAGSSGRGITFAVSTTALAAGRGDLFVALGIGRELARRGWRVTFADKASWAQAHTGWDVVVAMLPDFPVQVVDPGTRAVAWVRNETIRWAEAPLLHRYDLVLTSSRLSRSRLSGLVEHDVGLLPLGVDTELFAPRDEHDQVFWDAVTTANHWGRDRDIHRALARLPDDMSVAWYGAAGTTNTAMLRWHRGRLPYEKLPALYRGSRLVLDDLNHTTIPFGTVNSRVFEALASGALPVVNSRLGLADLGLEALPCYRSAQELAQVLRRSTADPEPSETLARSLSAMVRERHSWAVRAETLSRTLDELLASGPRGTGTRRTFAFYPDYRRTNPFQEFLYRSLPREEWVVEPTPSPLEQLIPRAADEAADPGRGHDGSWFHLHWTAPLLQVSSGPVDAFRRLRTFQSAVRRFKENGGRLAWTVHNALPHECTYRYAEIALARFLAQEADLIHVMSGATRDAVAHLYDLPEERCRQVALSSYEDAYPAWLTRSEARTRLGLKASEVVLLALGGIRPYKGLARFVDAFTVAAEADPSLRLVVAGKPGNFPTRDSLLQVLDAHPRVLLHPEFVPDHEIQVYARAADLAVLPHERSLNSAALMTALTFGLPVVAPDHPALADRLSPRYARVFAPRQDSIVSTIHAAVAELRTAEARSAARAAALDWRPDDMAAAFYQAVSDVDRHRGPRAVGDGRA